jgi:hypothetical protein
MFAGGLYVTAALGLESVGAYCAMIENSVCQKIEVIAEEGGEIIAIAIFVLALLRLLSSRYRMIAFRI